jgi:outer membrane protein assembly factor BamA
VFHYKSYYFSRTTNLGESFTEARRFSDRNIGFAGLLSYPLDRFRRFDFNLTNIVVDRSFYDVDPFGFLFRSRSELRVVTAPSAAYVNDTVLYGYYGPVSGSRYYLYATPAVPVFPKGLSYLTLAADWRRYWQIAPEYEFATRIEGLRSTGRDRQVFELGGYSSIRGYEDFSILGSNAAFANLEFRFPFINALGVVGPLPLGFFNLRGAAFADVGAVWNDDKSLRLSSVDPVTGTRRAEDLLLSAGVGARSNLGFLLLKLDVAWPYDLNDWGRPRYHFSLAPQF